MLPSILLKCSINTKDKLTQNWNLIHYSLLNCSNLWGKPLFCVIVIHNRNFNSKNPRGLKVVSFYKILQVEWQEGLGGCKASWYKTATNCNLVSKLWEFRAKVLEHLRVELLGQNPSRSQAENPFTLSGFQSSHQNGGDGLGSATSLVKLYISI